MMKLTRRSFLQSTTAVAAVAVIPWTITAHAAEIKTDDTPVGWLKCQGQRIYQHNYPDLYKVLGQAYREEDTAYLNRLFTFRVPDLRYERAYYNGNNSGSIPIEYIIKATGDDVGSIRMWSGISTVRGQRSSA